MAITRCDWAAKNPVLAEYHDKHWGRPKHDDNELFEYFILDIAEAGLNWLLILNKQAAYQKAYLGFDIAKVAKFTASDEQKLLNNKGIVRNKLKVKASINNARKILDLQAEFGSFANYLWGFVNNKPIVNNPKLDEDILVSSPESDALAKDLKRRGFTFVGTRIIYAFMQSVGMVDDHQTKCYFHHKNRAARAK